MSENTDASLDAADVAAEYRADWEADVVLLDGATAHLRLISPADGDALAAFHDRLSADTVRLRFFNAHPYLCPAEVADFTGVDGRDRVALVALIDGALVGVGRYDRLAGSTTAEVAFVVADVHQGRGLGTLLLEHLATIARRFGIDRFVAETLPDNHRMLKVFHDAGFAEQAQFQDGVIRVSLGIEPSQRYQKTVEERHRRAAKSQLTP
jgi:RimJ/RimL family protein N-acetyltransferase